MSYDLSTLMTTASAVFPPRLLIHGPPGLGKTSLAAGFPNPIILDIEQGIPAGVDIPTFGEITTFQQVLDGLIALCTQEHDRKTLIIDSLDRLETLVWQHTAQANGWQTLEDAGFGKGYLAADEQWLDVIRACNKLRRDCGMNIVYIAHSAITRFDDPTTGTYSRYDVRLHKRAHGLFEDEVDAILFLQRDVVVVEKKEGFGKTSTRGEGGNVTWIHTEGKPAFNAKNRFDMPARIQYDKGKGYELLKAYLPCQIETETKKEAA